MVLNNSVKSLQMSPVDDTFLSAGDDGTVRLWDLRTQACRVSQPIHLLNVPDVQAVVNDIGGTTIAAFDSSGVVFAVACSQTQTIMLYDSISLDDVSSKPGVRVRADEPRPHSRMLRSLMQALGICRSRQWLFRQMETTFLSGHPGMCIMCWTHLT